MSCVFQSADTGAYNEAFQCAKPQAGVPLGPSVGAFHTPISLFPSSRPYSNDSCDSEIKRHQTQSESASEIFSTPLDKGPSVGHIAGAFASSWFNSWTQVMTVIEGKASPSTSRVPDRFTCFMRYLNFVITSAKINQHSVMVASLYLCRFRKMCDSPVNVSPTSEARILITTLMVADKHEDDVSYTSATWAKSGNISLDEVKKMEIEFLLGLKFNLHISSQTWADFNHFVHSALFSLVNTVMLPKIIQFD